MDLLNNSWKMFVKQEEVGPWLHLWRRAKYFFDTDEDFRNLSFIIFATVSVLMLALIAVPWMRARRHRRQLEVMHPRIAVDMLKYLEENQNSLQEIVELLKRPNPEPTIKRVPLQVEPQRPQEQTTILLPDEARQKAPKEVEAACSSKNNNALIKRQSNLSKRGDPVRTKITTK